MTDSEIEKVYLSILVTCTMRRECKIARMEAVVVGIGFN